MQLHANEARGRRDVVPVPVLELAVFCFDLVSCPRKFFEEFCFLELCLLFVKPALDRDVVRLAFCTVFIASLRLWAGVASFYVEVVGHYLIIVLVFFAGMRLSDCHVACGADIHGGIFVVGEALLAFLFPGVRDDGMEL